MRFLGAWACGCGDDKCKSDLYFALGTASPLLDMNAPVGFPATTIKQPEPQT